MALKHPVSSEIEHIMNANSKAVCYMCTNRHDVYPWNKMITVVSGESIKLNVLFKH